MSRDGPKEVVGRGVWVAREGLERRRTLRERECGLADWVVDWAMVGVVDLLVADTRTSLFVLAYRVCPVSRFQLDNLKQWSQDDR